MWLEACPDAFVTYLSIYARANSGVYVVALQRRLGLYISSARATNDAILEAGGEPDYLGDLACNAGEHSTRRTSSRKSCCSKPASRPPRQLTLPSERVAYSPVSPNPAGFEPRASLLAVLCVTLVPCAVCTLYRKA